MDGKLIHLGCFTTEKDAATAYNEKAEELSEYFRLNEISGDESTDIHGKYATNAMEEEVTKITYMKNMDHMQ